MVTVIVWDFHSLLTRLADIESKVDSHDSALQEGLREGLSAVRRAIEESSVRITQAILREGEFSELKRARFRQEQEEFKQELDEMISGSMKDEDPHRDPGSGGDSS
jgi:hypothetical protein